MKELVKKVIEGDAKAIARFITLVENRDKDALNVIGQIHEYTGNAHIIGITGTMGVGKSTIIGKLAKEFVERGKKVGIIGIDPSSHFSGGALLGDRIRMQDIILNKNVFIRSMGTRGMLGGLTGAIYDVVKILDASGKDVIMVETVGVGQSEIDIVKMADTIVVVTIPTLGDSIQTLKAGITEIADIFVVNKSDMPNADATVMEIQSMLEMNKDGAWKTPVIKTIASDSEGIRKLLNKIEEHRDYLLNSKELEERRRKRYEAEMIEIIKRRLMAFIIDEPKLREKMSSLVDKILSKEVDPYTAADEILGTLLK
ncbi:MAG: methylmalonyl Co-A mutase-associated GTPase MeaB [Chloroflexi bacterium]|nr:MAG: methylmalonyl Co-A mutase-associated GTPase MeaB [Chloroflexota bacterium]